MLAFLMKMRTEFLMIKKAEGVITHLKEIKFSKKYLTTVAAKIKLMSYGVNKLLKKKEGKDWMRMRMV